MKLLQRLCTRPQLEHLGIPGGPRSVAEFGLDDEVDQPARNDLGQRIAVLTQREWSGDCRRLPIRQV